MLKKFSTIEDKPLIAECLRDNAKWKVIIKEGKNVKRVVWGAFKATPDFIEKRAKEELSFYKRTVQ